MAIGVLAIGVGFVSAPKTVEEAKAMVALHDDGHGAEAGQATAAEHGGTLADGGDHAEAGHGTSHDEHLLHQLQNKPWAALYVAAFFFL